MALSTSIAVNVALDTVTGPTLSVAVGNGQDTLSAVELEGTYSVMLSGQFIKTGGSLSTKEQNKEC